MSYTKRIRPHVEAELEAYESACIAGDFNTAFVHLERAHILGQASTRLHVRVHLAMLRLALRQRQTGAAWGQLFRLIGAALFTAIGLVPNGNTGGSNVSAFKPMEISADLQRLISKASLDE